MGATIKTKRLESLIQRRIAMLMVRDMSDPRIRSVTITRVKLSSDVSACTVYWSTLEEDGARRSVVRALADARGWLQREVAGVLDTRKTPILTFEFDESIEGVDRVFRLLRDVNPVPAEEAKLPAEESASVETSGDDLLPRLERVPLSPAAWKSGEIGDFRRIAIVRLSSFGDVVMALPALEGLRATYPHAQITWIVESRARNVLEGHPTLDGIIDFPRTRWRGLWKQRFGVPRSVPEVARWYRALREREFDLAIDFQGNLKSGTCTFGTRAPVRVGYARAECREWNTLFTNARWSASGQALHRMDRDLLLCGVVGVPYRPLPVRLSYSESDLATKSGVYGSQASRPCVVLHPGTSDFMPHKRWPISAWIALGDALVRTGEARVLLSWGPGEESTVAAVQRGMSEPAEILPPTPTVKGLGALLLGADLVIGSDTGPIHLAVVQGVPTICLLGPGDPRHYYPYGHPDRAFYRRTACSPCRHRSCVSRECMSGLEVGLILGKGLEILRARPQK